MVEIYDVSKRYGTIRAVSHVTLRVPKGSVLGLLGQNGAGKTTLINILTGCLAPDEGKVRIDGIDIFEQPERAKRLIGLLPEQPPLYDEMTVESYLSFCARLKGVTKGAVKKHIDEIIEKTGLCDMRRRLIGNLSKGYRQRTSFAQALCASPELLVLDEPTVGLDPKQITEIRALIDALRGENTILFSSHILSEVSQLCDSVVILNNGEAVYQKALRGSIDGEVTLNMCVLGDEKKLEPKLNQLENVRGVSLSRQAGGRLGITITFYGMQTPEKQVFDLLCGMGCPILELTRAQDTLESVFLQAISEDRL